MNACKRQQQQQQIPLTTTAATTATKIKMCLRKTAKRDETRRRSVLASRQTYPWSLTNTTRRWKTTTATTTAATTTEITTTKHAKTLSLSHDVCQTPKLRFFYTFFYTFHVEGISLDCCYTIPANCSIRNIYVTY